jgi:hypothetical protein
MLTEPLHGSAQGSHGQGHGQQTAPCSTYTCGAIVGAAIMGCAYVGAATGVASGVPMARGAPSTAGAMVVPQGEPLWNQLRSRPRQQQFEQPLLVMMAANAKRIVSFLMIGSPRGERVRVSGGRGALLQEGQSGRTSKSTTRPMMCNFGALIFCNVGGTSARRVLGLCNRMLRLRIEARRPEPLSAERGL